MLKPIEERLNNLPLPFGVRFTNALASPNFISGTSGWIIKDNGDIEFNEGDFRSNVIVGDETNGPSVQVLVDFLGTPSIVLYGSSNTLKTHIYNNTIQFYLSNGSLSGSITGNDAAVELEFQTGADGVILGATYFKPSGNNTISLGIAGQVWSDIRTTLINGQTPLAGTKVYYVADSSGGAVTRKLTFVGGILTSET